MTLTALRALPLSLCLLLAPAGLAFAQDTGVSDNNAEDLRYLSARKADRTYRTRIADELGDQVQGSGEVRRVAFDYDKDGHTFPVRGVLVAFDGVLIERYSFASLEEAVLFSDHDRANPNARHMLEVRGKDAIVLSGRRTSSQRRTLALREAAWTGRAATRGTDVLELKSKEEDALIKISRAGLDASPDIQQLLESIRPMADFLGDSPGATKETLPRGGFRIVFDDGVIGLSESPEGDLTLTQHPDEASEARLARFFKRVLPEPAPTSGANSGGLTSALGGAALPSTLELSDSGKTFKAKVGDTFTVRVQGNASTGYRWSTVDLSSKLELVSESSASSGGGPIGGGSAVEFEFRVKRSGTVELEMAYARSWDAANPAETLKVTINAK